MINYENKSKLILGTMHLSELNQTAVDELITFALSKGIYFFDFADIYGSGKSEALFGSFLKRNSSIRKDIVIQTKCGIRKGYYDLSKDYIIQSVNNSLERLNTSYIDILMLHRFDFLTDFKEINETFNYLNANSLVKDFGLSNMNAYTQKIFDMSLDIKPKFIQSQLSIVHSSLIDESIFSDMYEESGISRANGTIEYAYMNGKMIQAWSPLMASWDDGCFIDNPKYQKINDTLEKYANIYNVSKNTIAIAWLLTPSFNIHPVIGTTSIKHLEEILKAEKIRLKKNEWYDIYLSKEHKDLP